MKKLLSLFVHPTVLLILGLIIICLVIWFGGPLIEIADVAPLGPEFVRLLLIGLIIAFVVLRALWRWLRSKRLHSKLLKALTSDSPEQEAAPSAGQQQVADLGVSFSKAVEVLRNNPRLIKTQRNWFESVMARLRRQYLHDLPWYMIMGRPGSGKSTMLENSGLAFPLERTINSKRVRGEGGTRNCTWLFTDEAVLLDLAGRYTTHEADVQADAEAWQGFLELLRKTRTPRPINGVIVAISARDLSRDGAERREDAEILSARLHEIHDKLGIRFPVYIVVTQTDLLAGFNEFFASFDESARQSVWGMTFPFEEQPTHNWIERLPEELKALEERLFAMLPDLMQRERDPARRALVYAFPQEFAWNAHRLRTLLEDAFAPERHAYAPLVRGVYFTSAAQQGNPLDRVLGALSRTLGIRSGAQPAQGGLSFFIKRLLKDVIFIERDIAGTNIKAERRRGFVLAATYAAGAIATVAALAAWTTSYFTNKSYVAEVAKNVAVLKPRLPNQLEALAMRVEDVAPLLDAVQALPDTQSVKADDPPWLATMGLFQGNAVDKKAQETYRQLLRDLMLPRIAAHLRDSLRRGDADFGSLYERLKVYLMLHSPVHYKSETLKPALKSELLAMAPRNTDAATRAQVDSHVDSIIDLTLTLPPEELDKGAVAEAREQLRGMTLPDRIYQRLKSHLLSTKECSRETAFRVSDVVGPTAATIFTTADGQARSGEMPAYYTKPCYLEVFFEELSKTTQDAGIEEQWVMGVTDARATDAASNEALQEAVRRLYLQEYTQHWKELISKIRVAHTEELSRVVFTLNTLAAEPPDSPLPKLVKALGEQTRFQETTVADKVEGALSKLVSKLGKVKKVLPKSDLASKTKLEFEMVDRHFIDLHAQAFPLDDKQAAPIEALPKVMATVAGMMEKRRGLVEANQDPKPVDLEIKNELATQALKHKGTVKEIIENVGKSCSAATSLATKSAIKSELGALAKFCREKIMGHYPLTSNASNKVSLENFETMFRPGGMMDAFFKEKLAPEVDITGKTWRFTEGAGGQYSSALVQFQRAETIRQVYFKGGASSSMTLPIRLKLVKADPTNLEVSLNMDGELMNFIEGHPQKQFTWPGLGQMKGVRASLQFLPPLAGGSAIVREGPWALHEIVDAAKQEPALNGNLLLTFKLGERSAVFEVEMPYRDNPFNLQALDQFKCPEAL